MPEGISTGGSGQDGGQIKQTHLGHSILGPAHRQDPLNGTPRVVADGALGPGHPANLRHILTSLSDDRGSLRAGYHRANVDPARLILGGVLIRLRAGAVTVRGSGLDRLGLGMALAIGCIGDHRVTLGILGAFNGGDLIVRIGLCVTVIARFLVQCRALGFWLVVRARGRRGILERTLGRLKVGWRGRHGRCCSVFTYVNEADVKNGKLLPCFL